MTSLGTNAARGFAWLTSGAVVQTLLRLGVLAVLARLLTPAEFGLVGAGLVVVSWTSVFSTLGFGPALVQREAITARHIKTAMTISVALGLLTSALVAALAAPISTVFRMNGLAPLLRVMSLVLVVQAIGSVSDALLQRDLRFSTLAKVRVVSYVLGYAVVGLSAALSGWGAWSLVSAAIGQALCRTVLLLVAQRRPIGLGFDRPAFLDLLHFGTGLTLARVANAAALQGDNFVVARWLGAESLGLYTRGYTLVTMPATLIGQQMQNVLFPALSGLQSDIGRVRAGYRRAVVAAAVVGLPAAIVFVGFAPEIVRIVFGPQWDGAVPVVRILAAGAFLRLSYKASDSLTLVLGAVYRRAWRQFAYAALLIGGALLGSNWGLNGVAVAVVIALLVNFVLMAQLSIGLLTFSWGDFIRLHAGGAKASAWAIGVVVPVSIASDTMDLAPWVTLGVATVLFALLGLASRRVGLRVFVGHDAEWLGGLAASAFRRGRATPREERGDRPIR